MTAVTPYNLENGQDSTRSSVQPVMTTSSLTVLWSSMVAGDVGMAFSMFDAASPSCFNMSLK